MNPSECVKSQMFLTSADRPRQERSLVRFARRQKSPHLSLFEMPSMNRRLILNQLPWCCCYVNGVVRATSWLFLTMGKTGQGFLPPQTHPFSQHSPRVSSLHWQRQSHSSTLEPTAASTCFTGSPWRRSLSAESSTHVTLCFYHMMHFHTRVGFFFCHLVSFESLWYISRGIQISALTVQRPGPCDSHNVSKVMPAVATCRAHIPVFVCWLTTTKKSVSHEQGVSS